MDAEFRTFPIAFAIFHSETGKQQNDSQPFLEAPRPLCFPFADLTTTHAVTYAGHNWAEFFRFLKRVFPILEEKGAEMALMCDRGTGLLASEATESFAPMKRFSCR